MAVGDVVDVELQVEKEIAYKSESNWGSYACRPSIEDWDRVKLSPYGSLAINGVVPRLEIWSKWKAKLIEQQEHPKYGVSYRVQKIYQDVPTTIEEQKKYLETLLTQNQVDEIYKVYGGQDIIQLFKDDKIDHKKLFGFGQYILDKVRNRVLDNLELHEALIELIDYDLTYAAIAKLVREYGSASLVVQEIKNNPYTLCKLSGWGFKRVDTIALNVGYDREGEYRIHSAIRHLISEEQQSGNSYIMKDELLKQAIELLGIDKELIEDELKPGQISTVYFVDDKVTFEKTYNAERYIADKLMEFQKNTKKIEFDVDKFLNEKMQKENLKLTDQQIQFFHNFINNNVNFLVGYAGCGKSFLQSILLEMLDKIGMTYELLAPTGRAAKILSNYVKRDASTIHRASGIFDEDNEAINEIWQNVVIIDETSMADVYVLSKLFKVIKTKNPRILFIGDDFQLPSVQVGCFLFDGLNSGKFAVSKLTQVFRQSEGGILDIATKIRQNKEFVDSRFLGKKTFGDNTILHSVKQENMEKGYKHYYKEALKKFDKDDILVLSPTKKGKLGTFEVNKEIQKIVNPPSEDKNELKYGKDIVYRVGDTIINVKNTYRVKDQNEEETDIMNGDMGKIIAIDNDKKKVTIDFDFSVVDYPFSNMKNILHGYCLTIHKCITGNTMIYTDRGIKTIKELDNGAKIGEFKKVDGDIKVFNGTKLERPINFYNDGISECKKIITKRNYCLEATDYHFVDIMNEKGCIEKKKVQDLKVGDYLIINRKNDIFGSSLELPEEWQIRNNQDVRTVQYNRPDKMTIEFARFLGYMVADGTVCESGIRFSKRYKELTEDFQRLIYKLFGYKHYNIRHRTSGDYMYEVNSRDIRDFCLNINGILPHNKFVPECILKAPKIFQCEFLKSVFEDGTVNLKKNRFDHIELGMKSKSMSDQIRMILLNLGIVTTYYLRYKEEKKYEIHTLYIYKNDAITFLEEIGFISEFKRKRLETCLEGKNHKRHIIPYVSGRIRKLIKSRNINQSRLSVGRYSYCNKHITYDALGKLLECLSFLDGKDDEYDYLKQIYNRDLYFEPIKDIHDTKSHTYCLEMPESHKFIQNGFHAYNSQGGSAKSIIFISDIAHKYQLSGNLLYTGVTRAKEFLYLLAQAETINFGMKKNMSMERNSFLGEFLDEIDDVA